jgi:acyl phosphate:glycerol-3-phosphate acyltransferase
MDLLIDAALVIGAYLLGSVPQLSVLARLRHTTLSGDYHTSLWYRAGKLTAVMGIIGEFIRGAIPVLLGRGLGINLTAVAVAGVAVVCGQMWPIFHKFDGEKGNTTGVGMAAALDYRPFIAAVVCFAIGAGIRVFGRIIRRQESHKGVSIIGGSFSLSLPLGMLAGFLVLPVASWIMGEPVEISWAFSALFVLIVVRRLTAGLKRDLKAGAGIKRILFGRIFLDRGITQSAAESTDPSGFSLEQ